MSQASDLSFSVLRSGILCDCPGTDESMPVLQGSDASGGPKASWIRHFHWTGREWEPCDVQPMRPGPTLGWRQLPDDEESAVTARLLAAANSVPPEHWRRQLRQQAWHHVGACRVALQDELASTRHARNRLREARCLKVVAQLAGTPEGVVAMRLVNQGWSGTAAELRTTARAIAVTNVPAEST